MSSDRSEIRADVWATSDDPDVEPVKVGEVVVKDGDPPRFDIETDAGLVFSASLDALAWQLALMEPKLAQWLVKG